MCKKNKDIPLVSVLMPVYNVEKYVAQSINSVLGQTFSNFELILLDDCSQDNTPDVIQQFNDYRIKFVKNEFNLGLSANLNKGIELARGEYIARMDGDDIAVSFWLEKQLAVLEKYPEIGVCSAGFERFGVESYKVRLPEKPEDIKAQLLYNNAVIVPMIRKQILIDNNLRYRTDAFPAEDYMIWAECSKITKIYNIQETLFYYRTHPMQICSTLKEEQNQKVNEVRLFMLNLLSDDFSKKEKDFYVDRFANNKIDKKSDIKQLKDFSKLLITKNQENKFFNEKALKRCFNKNISSSIYSWGIGAFFKEGYSLKSYFRFIGSGIVLQISLKHVLKITLKCLLNKN